jgi:4-amino-4-deoxy-L-arabinose transferase-like glycosyltransferase
MSKNEQTRDPQKRWRLSVLLIGILSIGLVHGPLIGYKTFANVDEAYAGALAERLLDGHKLYQGAVSQRGPLMYYLFELLAWLHGWDNIVALRIWALGLAIVHVLLTYWVGRVLVSKTCATVAAAVAAYALAFGFPPEDAIAINGEPLQLPALLVAVVLGAVAVRFPMGSRARLLRLVGAGLAFGVAISIKQSVALHPLAVVLYLVIDARRRRASTRASLTELALLTVMTLVVPAMFVVHAAAQGTLWEMYYYCVVYNSKVHLNPTTEHFTWLGFFFFRLTAQTLFFTTLVVLFGRAIPWLARRTRSLRGTRTIWAIGRGFGNRHYLGVHLVLAVVAATSMYRFFPHYYLQAAPFMALCVGIAIDRWFLGDAKGWPARVVVTCFMLFLLFASTLGCVFGEKVDGRVAHDRTVLDVGKLIDATTKPEDKIFVWGFSPWIYQYSHRRPAGRYVFSTYVTGFVPWFWEKLDVERARIVPGSVEALLDDLDREKPAIVVDAGSVMIARPMRLYPKPSAWLHANYCFDMRIGAIDVYRRKVEGVACAVPFFPRAHGTVDYRGGAMEVAIPRTIDHEDSPPLPNGNFWKPLFFLGYPKPIGLDSVRDLKREKEEKKGADDGFFVPEIEIPIAEPPRKLEAPREPSVP